MSMKDLINGIMRSTQGSMAIETAIVTPVLLVLTFGTFEVGEIVARHHELQSAANEGEIIIMATKMGASVNVDEMKAIIRTSVDLSDSDLEITQQYRCGITPTLVASRELCFEDDIVSEYVRIEITEKYVPAWTAYGFGNEITLSVDRTVQVS